MNQVEGASCTRRSVLGMGAALAAGFGLTTCGKTLPDAAPSDSSAATDDRLPIATDAYIFGFPSVLMDVTRGNSAPANQFAHTGALPKPTDKNVVRVNVDTIYSQAWLDLRPEPMVLTVPAMIDRRYWSMQFLDAWSNTVHNPSSIAPQAAAPYTYVVTGPGFAGRLPGWMTHLPMPTATVWLLGRIQAYGSHDVGRVRYLQQRLRLTSLSAYRHRPRRLAAYASWPTAIQSPAATVADMDSTTFFIRMNAVMAANPPDSSNVPALRRFARIGIGPDARPIDQLPSNLLDGAVAEARRRIADYIDPYTRQDNGWMYATNTGTYGTDYLLRANVALRGLGASPAREAVYLTTVAMADVRGTRQRFRLHFPVGHRPPVDAFWSVTAYNADGYLVDNPACIYTVGGQRPVAENPDGSTDIWVQADPPGRSVVSGNWLPIPAAGPFSLTMRLYAPKPTVPAGLWQPPPLSRV